MKRRAPRLSPADRLRVLQLLQHFHSLGYGLRECNDPRRLRLEPKQLLPLASEAGCNFPDEAEFAAKIERQSSV